MDSFNSNTAKIVISPDKKFVEISDGTSAPKSYALSPDGITIVKKKNKLRVKEKKKLRKTAKVTRHKTGGRAALSLKYDDTSQRLVVGSTDISSGFTREADEGHFIGVKGTEEIGITLVNSDGELTVESGTVTA